MIELSEVMDECSLHSCGDNEIKLIKSLWLLAHIDDIRYRKLMLEYGDTPMFEFHKMFLIQMATNIIVQWYKSYKPNKVSPPYAMYDVVREIKSAKQQEMDQNAADEICKSLIDYLFDQLRFEIYFSIFTNAVDLDNYILEIDKLRHECIKEIIPSRSTLGNATDSELIRYTFKKYNETVAVFDNSQLEDVD